MNKRKLLKKILVGSKSVRFDEWTSLIEAFGFRLKRITGSHHIFEHPAVPEIINIQSRQGMAKPYQIRQLLELIEQHHLILGDDR